MTTDTSFALRKDRMTGKKAPSSAGIGWNAKEEKELEDIFIRTYGKDRAEECACRSDGSDSGQ